MDVDAQKQLPSSGKRQLVHHAASSLRRRTSICQKIPAEYEEKPTAFQCHVIALHRQHNYIIGQINNADEAPTFLDMPSNYALDVCGSKEVHLRTTGTEKTRVTAMLACTADAHKLPSFLIFERKTIPKNETFPPRMHIGCSKEGWMDSAMMRTWLCVVWDSRMGASLKTPSTLVLNVFRGHLTDKVKMQTGRPRATWWHYIAASAPGCLHQQTTPGARAK